MTSSSMERTSFGRARWALAFLLGFGFILGFILTPLGVETRRMQLRSSAFAVFFITVGLLLPLVGLVLLFRRPKLAAVLAAIDAVLLFLTAPADQVRMFFTVPPPPAVTTGEFALILVGIGYLLYGRRVYVES